MARESQTARLSHVKIQRFGSNRWKRFSDNTDCSEFQAARSALDDAGR